ncbi:helix-turn-helix transcriptional regulator [Lachnospiraceae bacterium 50-23]|jgi:transcriptional regulator with XRE-family HTH domain|nr:helix-turn-helix transcriptional regulator [Dorea sp.]
MKKEIGFRVRQARINADLTQEELAEKASVSSSFISRLENGRVLPSIDRLYMLADILDVGLQDLLCDLFRQTDNDSSSLTDNINYYIELMTIPEKQYFLEYVKLFHRYFGKS